MQWNFLSYISFARNIRIKILNEWMNELYVKCDPKNKKWIKNKRNFTKNLIMLFYFIFQIVTFEKSYKNKVILILSQIFHRNLTNVYTVTNPVLELRAVSWKTVNFLTNQFFLLLFFTVLSLPCYFLFYIWFMVLYKPVLFFYQWWVSFDLSAFLAIHSRSVFMRFFYKWFSSFFCNKVRNKLIYTTIYIIWLKHFRTWKSINMFGSLHFHSKSYIYSRHRRFFVQFNSIV